MRYKDDWVVSILCQVAKIHLVSFLVFCSTILSAPTWTSCAIVFSSKVLVLSTRISYAFASAHQMSSGYRYRSKHGKLFISSPSSSMSLLVLATHFIYFRFDQLLCFFSMVENSRFVTFPDEAPDRPERRACYFIQRTKKRLMLLKYFLLHPQSLSVARSRYSVYFDVWDDDYCKVKYWW